MGASTIAPPDGFVEDVSPPEGFVEDTSPPSGFKETDPSPPDGFIDIESHNREAERIRGLAPGSLDEPARDPNQAGIDALARLSDPSTLSSMDAGMGSMREALSEGTTHESLIDLPKPTGTGRLAGTTRAIENAAEGLLTPKNIALMASLGGTPAVVQKVAAGVFGAQAALQVPGQLVASQEAATPGERFEAGTGAAINSLFSVLGALGVMHTDPLPTISKEASIKTIAEAPDFALRAAQADPKLLESLHPDVRGFISDELAGRDSGITLTNDGNLSVAGEVVPNSKVETPTEEGSRMLFNMLPREEKPIVGKDTHPISDTYPEVNDAGLPIGPGKMTEGELPPQETTGLKRDIVDTERLSRGAEEIPTVERQHEEHVVQAAEDRVDSDPNHAPSLVSRIVDQGDTAISEHEAATLLVERQRIMNLRTAAEERLASEDATTAERAVARASIEDSETQLDRIDQAQRAAGSTWGRLGHMYQRLIREDFTLDAMERKERIARGRPLTEDERATIKQQAEQISELQKKADAAEAAQKDAEQAREVARTHEATIRDLQGGQKFGKEVFDIAHGIVNRWKAEAAESTKALRSALGQTNIGVDPTLILHVAKILRAKIGEFGVDKAEAFTQMAAEFGEAVKPHLEKAWTKARELIGREQAPPKVKSAVAKGVAKKGEKTVIDIKARSKAESTAAEPLSHKTVYELARAHINAGVHGEDNVMSAVHKDIKEAYPDATERDVRRAFSEYGKVKFPSAEADKAELRELRTLTRLQESIDRETEGLDSLHTGLQRDKATQAIREKQKQLNELLKKRQGPPSPENLASRDEARKTALRNQIEDLDKQLRTGEKAPRGTPLADSPEVERLKAERDAMKAKLAEIEAESHPPTSPEQRYNEIRSRQIAKQLKEVQGRISSRDYAPLPKKVQPDLSPENRRAKVQLEDAKDALRKGWLQMQAKNRPGWQKALEHVAGAARASALSGYHTLAKLASFDLSRAIETPVVEAVGKVLSKTPGFRGVFEKSTMESGPFLRDMRNFYVGMAVKGMKAAGRVLTKGRSEDAALYGKKEYLNPKWYDFFGKIHQAEKAPLLTGTKEMYLQRGYDAAIKAGLDVNDEFVKAEINRAAYEHSQSAILQENNKFAESVNMLHSRLEKANPKTGKPEITNMVISTLVRTLLTKGIVRTPANYIAQTIARTPIGLVTGISKAVVANHRGIENLSPIEANATAKLIKAGAVGSAFFLLGAIDATKPEDERTFGGYWEPGRKRAGKDVGWGKLRIAGRELPHIVTHNPLTESAQMGSTMMRVALSKYKKSDADQQGLLAGAVKALVGLASKAPVASPAMRMGDSSANIGADLATGLVPQLLQNIAEDTDSKERSPKTTTDKIKATIPGLRQQTPARN